MYLRFVIVEVVMLLTVTCQLGFFFVNGHLPSPPFLLLIFKYFSMSVVKNCRGHVLSFLLSHCTGRSDSKAE